MITNVSSSVAYVTTFQEGARDLSHFGPTSAEVVNLYVATSCLHSNDSIVTLHYGAASVNITHPFTVDHLKLALTALSWPYSTVTSGNGGAFALFIATSSSIESLDDLTLTSQTSAYIRILTDGGLQSNRGYDGGNKAYAAGWYECRKPQDAFYAWRYYTGYTNAGVVSKIANTEYSIGYSVLEVALAQNLDRCDVYNVAGSLITASSASLSYAMMEQGGNFDSEFTATLVDSKSSNAWSIAGYTYFVLRKYSHTGSCARRKCALEYLLWFYESSAVDEAAQVLGFATLPSFIRTQVLQKLYTQFYCSDDLTTAVLADLAAKSYSFPVSSEAENILQTYANTYYAVDSTWTWSFLTEGSSSTLVDAFANDPTMMVSALSLQNSTSLADAGVHNVYSSPFLFYGVVPTYHLEGSSSQISGLVVSATVLDLIYKGDITHWNDSRIKALNPTVTLPHTAFVPIYRSDVSDTNYIFTKFMSVQTTASTWTASTSFSTGCPYFTSQSSSYIAVSTNNNLAASVNYADGSIGYWLANSEPTTTLASLLHENEVLVFTASVLQQCEHSGQTSTYTTPYEAVSGEVTSRTKNDYVVVVDTFTGNASCWPMSSALNVVIRSSFSASACAYRAIKAVDYVGWLFNGTAVVAAMSRWYSAASTTLLRNTMYSALEDIYCNGSSILREDGECTNSDYQHVISACDERTDTFTISFSKKLTTFCQGGYSDPSDTTLECDYVSASSTAGILCIVLTCFGIVCSVTACGWLILNRAHKVVQKSQPIFLYSFLFGSIGFQLVVFLLIGPATDARCASLPWMFNVFSTIMFGSLFMKINRVNVLFNNPKLRKLRINNLYVIMQITGLLSVDVLIQTIWDAVDAPLKYTYIKQDIVGVDITHEVCHFSSRFLIVCSVYKTLLLVFGVYLSVRCWSIPSEFSEAKHLALAIYQVAVVGGLAYLLIAVLSVSVQVQTLLMAIGILLASTGSVAVALVPKVVFVLSGMEGMERTSGPTSAAIVQSKPLRTTQKPQRQDALVVASSAVKKISVAGGAVVPFDDDDSSTFEE
jgi:ABC-type phosphate transport system substrate-binding protein